MNKPYRIGIDARMLRSTTGGLGRYTQELLHHLAALDAVNEYFVFITSEDKAEWDITNRNFHTVVVDAPHYTLKEQTKFRTVLLQHNLDLVHFLNFNHPLRYTKPFVTTLHDMTLYFFPAGRSKKSKIRLAAFRLIFRHALIGAKRVIAISQFSAEDAQKHIGISSDKISVIYEGGPDKSEYSLEQVNKVQAYLKTDQPYFIFVSQWRPHKGIVTLLEAFAQYKKQTNAPHKLVLIGNQKAAGTEVIAELEVYPYKDDLIMPGFAPEELLPALYHGAVACVIPSEYEGFGLPVLEAFRYKVPVIVADNSSLPEVAGDAALYFPTKDVQALAQRLEKIGREGELRQELIQKGTKQLQKFSWEKTAKETLQVYMDVLKG